MARQFIYHMEGLSKAYPGGKKVLEKDPKTNVGYLLDFDAQSSQLRWHVIYGSDSIGKLTVLVDASSGAFLRKE